MNFNKSTQEDLKHFDKDWFKKHAKKLYFLNNAPLVRFLWRKLLNITRKEKINHIEPNAVYFDAKKVGEEIKVKGQFIGVNKYSRKIYGLSPFMWGMYIAIKKGVTWDSVFDLKWFEQFQSPLLYLVNNWKTKFVFRKMLKMKHDTQEDVTQMYPHAITYGDRRVGDKIEKEYTIFGVPKYAQALYKWFYPLWATLHGLDSLFKVTKVNLNFGYDSFSVIPDADAEVATVDGMVRRTGVDETFSTIRAGAGTDAFPSTASAAWGLNGSSTTDQYDNLRRSFWLFDTSIIGSGNELTAASIVLYSASIATGLGAAEFDIVSSNPASNTDLVTADFTTLGTTVYGSIASGSIADTAYNAITLDAAGRATISLTGISKFGGSIDWDTNNSFAGTWASGVDTVWNTHYSDGTNKPKLTVTVTEIFVPDASVESTSVDGYCRRGGVDQTLTNIRAGAGTASDDTAVAPSITLRASTTTDQFQTLDRAFLLFDTSAIGAGATVDSAAIDIFPTGRTDGLGTTGFEVDIVASTPASNTALVNADYAQLGSTVFASLAYASVVEDTYNTFTLDANGEAAVDVEGVSKYGARNSWDTDNSFGGVWASSAQTYVIFLNSDKGWGEPLLTVAWSLPATGYPNLLLLGVG